MSFNFMVAITIFSDYMIAPQKLKMFFKSVFYYKVSCGLHFHPQFFAHISDKLLEIPLNQRMGIKEFAVL